MVTLCLIYRMRRRTRGQPRSAKLAPTPLVGPFTHEHRQRIIDFAAKRLLPAMYESREFVDGGGLVSYGPNLPALQRRAADCISMIFKSSKPGDIPVEQPTKFELIIGHSA